MPTYPPPAWRFRAGAPLLMVYAMILSAVTETVGLL